MSPARTILAAAIALAVAACTDTPTATESVDGLAFAKGGVKGAPDNSGVVERSTTFAVFVITDEDAGLRATVGFDRVRWCADGHDFPEGIAAEYRTEHDFQTTFHGDDQRTVVVEFTGPLVVYNSLLSVRRCSEPLVGAGTGRTTLRFIGPAAGGNVGRDIFLQNSGGFITAIADGRRKRVNVASTHLDGIRMNPSSDFHEISSHIIVR